MSLSSDDDDDDDEDEPEEQEEEEDEELDPDRDEEDDEDEDLVEELEEELDEDPSESVSEPDLLLASLRLLLLNFFCFRSPEFGVSGFVLAATIRFSLSPPFSSMSSFPTTAPEGVGGLTEGLHPSISASFCRLSCSTSERCSSLGKTSSSLGAELASSGDAETPEAWFCSKGVGVRDCPSNSAWVWV